MIATFGLIQNSAAVIIGAMLIAPLMSPILAIALALVRGDLSHLPRALGTLLIGALLAVGLSALLGLLVTTGTFNFLVNLPSEILGRTHPNLFDLVIALAGGGSAAYALANPRLSATLPGVAIATALMPPLCVVGIGTALQRQDIWSGALVLFLTNLIAIVCAASFVFELVGFRPIAREHWRGVLSWTLVVNLSLLVVLVLPLSASMIAVAQRAQLNAAIRSALIQELDQLHSSNLVDFSYTQQAEELLIEATLRSAYTPTLNEARQIQEAVAIQLQRPIALKLLVIPVKDLEPFIPPTPTPSPTLSEAAVATVTQPSPIPTTPATPTAAPTLTPIPTPSPIAPVYAVVGAAEGARVNARRFPGQGAIVTQIAEGTVVMRTGGQRELDGTMWSEAILPDGRVVWIAEQFLVPVQTFRAPAP